MIRETQQQQEPEQTETSVESTTRYEEAGAQEGAAVTAAESGTGKTIPISTREKI